MTALQQDHHAPGALYVLAAGESLNRPPEQGRMLTFGRNKPNVDLCVAGSDDTVSRELGVLTFDRQQWWLTVTGTPGVEVTGERHGIPVTESQLVRCGDEPWPLDTGYTSLVVKGNGGRLHVLEVLVFGAEGHSGAPCYQAKTRPKNRQPSIEVTEIERLAVVVIAQDYLRGVLNPRPVSWNRAAELLAELDPDGGWTRKTVEHRMRTLRLRLAARHGLQPPPDDHHPGDTMKHALIKALVEAETIGPDDIDLIDLDRDERSPA